MNSGYRTASGRPVSPAAVRLIRREPPRSALAWPASAFAFAAAVCLLAASSSSAVAEPLTFDEALALAGSTAPQLRASAVRVEAASAPPALQDGSPIRNFALASTTFQSRVPWPAGWAMT